MKPVRMYTTPICPYCVRAKSLLSGKGALVEEIDIFMDDAAREEMLVGRVAFSREDFPALLTRRYARERIPGEF